MRPDFKIAILLALAAIPAGVALMAAPEYIGILKEHPGPFFWGGLILASGLIGAATIIAVRGEALEPRSGHRRRMIALAGMVICGVGFLGFSALYFWPTATTKKSAVAASESTSALANQTLPGFSATFGLKILNVPALRRQYVFHYEDAEAAKVDLYFSPNDLFIFSGTDVRGEAFSLEIPVGNNGIPIYKFMFLSCEIGVSSNATYLRVLVDGKEVQSRDFSYRADLGSRNWEKGRIGADAQGQNNSAFEIAAASMGHVTLTNKNIEDLINRLRDYLKSINFNFN